MPAVMSSDCPRPNLLIFAVAAPRASMTIEPLVFRTPPTRPPTRLNALYDAAVSPMFNVPRRTDLPKLMVWSPCRLMFRFAVSPSASGYSVLPARPQLTLSVQFKPESNPSLFQVRLAARATGAVPTVSSAAATIKDAREKRGRDFELFIRINLGRPPGGDINGGYRKS